MSEEPKAPTYTENMVAALLEERKGYISRNLPDRLQAVDKQLEAYGHDTSELEQLPDPNTDSEDAETPVPEPDKAPKRTTQQNAPKQTR